MSLCRVISAVCSQTGTAVNLLRPPVQKTSRTVLSARFRQVTGNQTVTPSGTGRS